MYNARIKFSKTGRAIWISHLDLMHTLQRAFTRAGVIICHSEGFNPHPQMSIALPLSVGMESVCEILDIKTESQIEKDSINSVLPEGIEILDIYESSHKVSEIKWLEIESSYEAADSNLINDFYKSNEIIISKKSKRGVSDVDICPMIKRINFEINSMNAIISAQNPTLNPNNLIDALIQHRPELVPVGIRFKRVNIYDQDLKVFR